MKATGKIASPTGDTTTQAPAVPEAPLAINTRPLFKLMVEKKASDLFFTSNAPIKIKIEGQIFPVNKQILTPETVRQSANALMTPEQLEYFHRELEIDFAISEPGLGRFRVKANGPGAPARSLSGGNLQKFIMGREIDARPKLLIVSQPTWGVDVGAAAQIRAEILALAGAGCAVLVVSEELDELFEICDRLHVIAKGRLSPSVARRDASVEQIGEWMSGLWHEGVQQHLQQMDAAHAAA